MGKELVSYTATPIEGDVARFQFDDPGSATSNSLTGLAGFSAKCGKASTYGAVLSKLTSAVGCNV